MEKENTRKLVVLVAVVSASVSLLVSIVAIGLATGREPGQVLQKIVETAPAGLPALVGSDTLSRDEVVVAVVKKVSPAVVSVVATKDVPIVQRYYVDPFGSDPFFRQFFGDFSVPQYREQGTQKQEVSAGSGFVVSSDGLILTNKHVVADTAADYTVFFNDGSKIAAKVLARDPVQDLAVLKVAKSGLASALLGDSSSVEIGQSVIAIGNALGEFSNTVSVGIISGLHRSISASGGAGGPEELQELIQTDAAINPGNSGGPLLNLKGEVIGINTAMAQGAQNVGFAFPINQAKRDIESVKATGRIIYPFLGVRYAIVTPDLQAERGLPVDYGAIIDSSGIDPAITPGSPAEKVGLKSGDIILEFNGARVDQKNPLAGLIQKYKAGDTVSLKILRGKDTLALSATLVERK